MSGGSGHVTNPPQISSRDDVDKGLLASDSVLTFVGDKVLPITTCRPSLAAYTQVSSVIQDATASIFRGTSPSDGTKAPITESTFWRMAILPTDIFGRLSTSRYPRPRS